MMTRTTDPWLWQHWYSLFSYNHISLSYMDYHHNQHLSYSIQQPMYALMSLYKLDLFVTCLYWFIMAMLLTINKHYFYNGHLHHTDYCIGMKVIPILSSKIKCADVFVEASWTGQQWDLFITLSISNLDHAFIIVFLSLWVHVSWQAW